MRNGKSKKDGTRQTLAIVLRYEHHGTARGIQPVPLTKRMKRLKSKMPAKYPKRKKIYNENQSN